MDLRTIGGPERGANKSPCHIPRFDPLRNYIKKPTVH